MLLGTMSGKIPQGKCKEANFMHVSSSKDFCSGIRVGNKPTPVQWKNMAAFSQNPLPILCPQGLPERPQWCSGFLPGRNCRAHRHLLENVANVSSHSWIFLRRRGNWGLMGFSCKISNQHDFLFWHQQPRFACTLVSLSPRMVPQVKGGWGIRRSWQEDCYLNTQIWDCEASSAFHRLEQSVLCPLLLVVWLMPQMKS